MNEDLFHLGIKAIIRNNEGEILLNRKISDQYWDLPGGRIAKGETIRQAVERELLEEIGTNKIKSLTPFAMVLSNLRLQTNDGEVGLILSVYLCDLENPEGISAKEEGTEIGWLSPSEAAKMLTFKYPEDFLTKIHSLT